MIQNIHDYVLEKRRYFHQNPELGFQETGSSTLIIEELQRFGYEIRSGIAGTGVVALKRADPGLPVIMLRFDMDALPIQEETHFSYQSRHDGIMHACGHDAHMAIGLGVARELQYLTEPLSATIMLLFQPAEEGLGGAQAMISEGVLNGPKPDYCLALHVWNEQPVGWVALTEGAFMAGADTFQIDVGGKGGHGALPQDTIDPILASAQIIQSLQSIISRNLSPLDSGVLSICSIHGGSVFNVIPQSVTLKGTIRYMESPTRELIHQRLVQVASRVGSAFECETKVSIQPVTPPVINNAAIIQILAKETLPAFPELTGIHDYQSLVSEDFSLFLNLIPGCFLFLGSGLPDKQDRYGHHHPKFNIDERVLDLGVKFLVKAVQDIINFRNG